MRSSAEVSSRGGRLSHRFKTPRWRWRDLMRLDSDGNKLVGGGGGGGEKKMSTPAPFGES